MERSETVQQVLDRFKGLEAVRQPWSATWKELTEYMLPRKNSFMGGTGMVTTRGVSGDEYIYDSTPMNALELLASALGGLLTNPALPWFEIRVRDRHKGDAEAVCSFLQMARERMVSLFNSEDTGFQTHVHELYLDLVLLGTGVMYVEADPDAVVRFSTRPLGEVFVAESARGVVDTVVRRYELTLRQAVQEWGDRCSDDVLRRVEDRPEEKVEILHAVFPRTDRDPFGFGSADFPFASVYLEMSTKHLLDESGYLEMPYMVPRWSKAAGEIYGRGPGLTALSDVRVLNAMGRTALMAAEKMSDPPLMVPDDGFLGPIHSGPGGLSYYRAGSSDRIESLPVRVDLKATEQMMDQRRESIRRIFLNDQLTTDGPAMSATEAVIRQSERMRVLGPVLGRIQTEFLSPLIHRVFRVMLRAGALPKLPNGLSVTDLEVGYTSPLAKAQRQYEAQGLTQTMQYLSPLVGGADVFGVMDNFATDRVARHAAELFGVPADYMLPESDVTRSRQAKSRAGQSAQSAQSMASMIQMAKTLSEIQVGDSNALTALLGGLGRVAQPGGPSPEPAAPPQPQAPEQGAQEA